MSERIPLENPELLRLNGLALELDEATKVWSGGFHQHPIFGQIEGFDEQAIPILLDDLRTVKENPDNHIIGTWWRFEIISKFAELSHRPVYIPKEHSGKHDPVLEDFLAWGEEQGYLTSDNS